MRTPVDIPDPLYRRLKSAAALRGCSVKDLVLRGVTVVLQESQRRLREERVTLPLIDCKDPGRLQLTNQRINQILFP